MPVLRNADGVHHPGYAQSVRASPPKISRLEPGEIFVFGSNAGGRHGGGAARYAVQHFGAVWGQGSGIQGQSYAIDSMSGLSILQYGVQAFLAFAESRPDLTFLVTEVGCGIAGHSPEDVAPFFADPPTNVRLPQSFIDTLTTIEVRNPTESSTHLLVAEFEAAIDALPEEADGWLRSDNGDVGRLANLDDSRLLESIARAVLLDSAEHGMAGHELLLRALAAQQRWTDAASVLHAAEERYWMWIDLGTPADLVQLAWVVLAHEVFDTGDVLGACGWLVSSAHKALDQHVGWDRDYLLMALRDLSLMAPEDEPTDRSDLDEASALSRRSWAHLALRLLARFPDWSPGRWFTDEARDRLINTATR